MRLGKIRYAEFNVGGDPLDPSIARGGDHLLGVIDCPLRRRAKLTSLVASVGAARSTSFREAGHGEVPADKARHFQFAPGVEAPTLTWVVENVERARAGALTVYKKGDGAVVWSAVLDAGALARGSVAWAGAALTAQHSPYLVQLTLTDGAIEAGYEAAWTYVDVLLAEEIALAWGDAGEIPDARTEGGLTDLAWTLREEAATLARLAAPDGHTPALLTADHKVLLESNLFRDCHGHPSPAGDAHSGVAAHRAHWGDGPRVPVVAKVQVLNSRGDAVWAPDAVGDLELLWDWEDPREDFIDPWTAWIVPAETSALNQRVLETSVVRSNLTTEPKSFNCATAYGGKVGSAARVLPAAAPGARFKCRVDALAGQGRNWAAVTRTGSDATRPGRATVLFQPSRMAGDQYKLSVYLKDGGLDLAKKGSALRSQAAALHVPRAATGTFEVRRRTTVYSFHPAGVNTAWGTIRDSIYAPAGVALEVIDTPFSDQEYADALDEGLTFFERSNPMAFDLALCVRFAIQRGCADCAVPVESYPKYVSKVREAFKDHFVYKLPVPTSWFGGLQRGSDGAKFQIVHGEAAGSKNFVYVLALDNDALHKGDALAGTNIPAQTLTLRDEPQALAASERDRLCAIALSGGGGHTSTLQNTAQYANLLGQLNLVKHVSRVLMESLAASKRPNIDVGAFIFQFPRTTLGDAAGGSCLWVLTGAYKAFAWAATPPPDPALPLLKTGTVVTAHEFGHALFLQHARNTLRDGMDSPAAPVEDEQHVPFASCLMSYDHDSSRLCGVCMLHLRGWDLNALSNAVSNSADFKLPGVLALLQADITADGANPWHKVRYYTALSYAKKHQTERDTHKGNVRGYIAAVAGGAQGGAARISVLRNLVLHWLDWLDACATITPGTLHALYRELNTLTTKVEDVGPLVTNALTRRGDAFCDHKVRARLAVTTNPANGVRGVLTLRAEAVAPPPPAPPPPAPLWAAEPFDGLAELSIDRPSVTPFDAANAGNPLAQRSIAGARLNNAGLAAYLEDASPGSANYQTQHVLKLSGGSQLITVTDAPATVPWPLTPAPRRLKVTPAITYVGDAVLVGTDPARTPRRPLTLKTDKTFDGTGVFECSGDALEFWDALVGGAKLAFDGAANAFPGATLYDGKPLYVSAKSPSHAVDDIALRLTLNPGPTPLETSSASKKLTAVKVTLSACRTPTTGTALGERVAPDVKLLPGRFVQRQDGVKHARIPVIIEKATPLGYKGKLCLQEISAASRLAIFKSQTPSSKEQPIDYFTVTNDDVPTAGQVLWVQGATTSGALADAVLDLGIKDGKGDGRDYFQGGDQIAVTVVELTSVQIDLPATPPLHPLQYRQVNRGNPQAQRTNGSPRAAFTRTPSDTLDVTASAPLTLVRGSCEVAADQRAAALSAPSRLTVVVAPAAAAAHVRWTALRNETDHATVKGLSGPPALTVSDLAHPERVDLGTNAVGCFHVVASIDPEGTPLRADHFSAKRQPPAFVLNVALVQAAAHGAPAAACNAAAYLKLSGTMSADADFGAHFTGAKAANLSAAVNLVGGGPDGKLGVDKVVCGWVQNTTAASYPATYRTTNGVTLAVHQRFVVNPSVTGEKFHEDFIAYPGHALVELVTPFLDTFRDSSGPRPGAPRPAMGDSTQVDAAGAPCGQRRTVTMSDGPSRTVEGSHPNSKYRAVGAKLVRLQWDLQFRAHLTVAADSAPDLFAVLGHVDWRARLDWNVQVHNNHAQNTIAAETTPITVTALPAVVHPAAVMGVDAGAEFCWPSMIYSQLWDATDDPSNLGAP